MARPPKPLSLGGTAPEVHRTGGTQRGSAPPPLSVPARPTEASAAPAPAGRGSRAPAPLSAPQQASSASQRAPGGAPRTLGLGGSPQVDQDVERLVEIAVTSDRALEQLKHRLRPRFKELSSASDATLLCWGEQNLEVMTKASAVYSGLANRVSQLSVEQWVTKCLGASTRPPGLLSNLFGREKPETYEARFRQLQSEMGPLLVKLTAVVEELRPELEDLRLDVASLAAVTPRYTDPTYAILVSNRLRTLTAGHQTAVQLLLSAEACRQTVMQYCQKLDQLISVTIPAWRLTQTS